MSIHRRITILGLTLGALFLASAPAHAQSVSTTSDAFVVLTGRIDIAQGQNYSDAVIFNGPVTVAGSVENNVVAFNGDVLVTGSVGGDVVSLNGRVIISSGAHVGGNVESQTTPVIAPGTVAGEVRHVSGIKASDVNFPFLGRLFIWLIATCSSFLLGLVLTLWMPRAADAMATTSKERLGATFGFGALWFFAIPVAGAVLAVTVLAGLIGVGLLLGLVLIYTVAYAVGAFLLGRRILPAPRGRFVSFIAGWAILRLVAIVPRLGGLAWTLTVIAGLGALMIAAWRAARRAPATGARASMGSVGPGGTPPIPPMPR